MVSCRAIAKRLPPGCAEWPYIWEICLLVCSFFAGYLKMPYWYVGIAHVPFNAFMSSGLYLTSKSKVKVRDIRLNISFLS